MLQQRVSKAQHFMKHQCGKNIGIDGHFGPQSHRALLSLKPHLQEQVYNILVIPVDNVYEPAVIFDVPTQHNTWVLKQSVNQIYTAHKDKYGTTIPLSWVHSLCEIETASSKDAYKNMRGGASGMYYGIGQFGLPAWTDHMRGVPWNKALDANYMVPAIVRFIEYNRRYYDRNKAKNGFKSGFTKELMYLMHNQGPGGAINYLKSGRVIGRQSPKAMKTFAIARQQVLS